MGHPPQCDCDICKLLGNHEPWMGLVSSLRYVHSRLASDLKLNPARMASERVEKRYLALPPEILKDEKKNQEELHKIVKEEIDKIVPQNPECWMLAVLGSRECTAQLSDVRLPSPYDCGERKFAMNLFYSTAYCGHHRVTISIA